MATQKAVDIDDVPLQTHAEGATEECHRFERGGSHTIVIVGDLLQLAGLGLG